MSQWFLRALARINPGLKISPFSFDFGRRYTSVCFVYLSLAYSWPHTGDAVKKIEGEEERAKFSPNRIVGGIPARVQGKGCDFEAPLLA